MITPGRLFMLQLMFMLQHNYICYITIADPIMETEICSRIQAIKEGGLYRISKRIFLRKCR